MPKRKRINKYPLPVVLYRGSKVYTVLKMGHKWAHAIRFGTGARVEAVRLPPDVLKSGDFRCPNRGYSGEHLLDTWVTYATVNGVANKQPLDLISKSRYHKGEWQTLEIT